MLLNGEGTPFRDTTHESRMPLAGNARTGFANGRALSARRMLTKSFYRTSTRPNKEPAANETLGSRITRGISIICGIKTYDVKNML